MRTMKHVPQALVMAAIVATALLLPFAGLLGLLGYLVLGISLQDFVTFGGALDLLAGVLAWWALAWVAAMAYAAFMVPHGR